jgi:ribosomal protein S18 acetylase RimI-like enzyme
MKIFLCGYLLLINICLISAMQFVNASSDIINTSFITIHRALADDLVKIIELDAEISHEYFKPLFLQYPEYQGKEHEVEKMLAAEVETDALWFADCIAMKDINQRLFIARYLGRCIGFIACHRQDDTIAVIDLLMIDAPYRGKGIGKQLIQICIEAFPEATTCMLVVLDKNEQARISYEKMGFALMVERPSFVQEKYPKPRYLCYRLRL